MPDTKQRAPQTASEDWVVIKQIHYKLIQSGYSFLVDANSCVVYRFDELIFAIKDLNNKNDSSIENGLLAHWSAAIGAASAHLSLHPKQTPRSYPGLDS